MKLNETTANELLFQLHQLYNFSMEKDCVTVKFYANRKADSRHIATAYTVSCMGEWLLEKTVKAFTVEYQQSRADNETIMMDISIVLNMA